MKACWVSDQFSINACLESIAAIVWSAPLILALVGIGLYLSIRFKAIQFRALRHAIRIIRGKYDNSSDPGEISHFQALCTALSATVGLGNIAGVALAITLGGPGAVFWMTVVGVLGMATKFAESSLAIMYRKVEDDGTIRGGPMYYISMGLESLGRKKLGRGLAGFFAFACIWTTFGSGNMFQSNQVADIMNSSFSIPFWITGLILSLLTGVVILGGIKRIGKVTSYLLPFMGIFYFLGALVVIFSHMENIPSIFYAIFHDAFNGSAAVGGFTGIVVGQVITQGVRRACFSNEAGLGSAAIAHSAASTKEPIREGLVAMVGPLVDTVIICNLTALVILSSGIPFWESQSSGVTLTAQAFNTSIPGFGTYFIPIAVFFFAYSTILSWSYYGESCTVYLFGKKYVFLYKIFYCGFIICGSLWSILPVLNLSDIFSGLMVAPNVLAIFLLRKKLIAAADDYFKRFKSAM